MATEPRDRIADVPFEGFRPLRPAPRGTRALVLIVGPLLWLAALIVVGVLVRHARVVEFGIALAFCSLILSTIYLLILRARRDHRRRPAVTEWNPPR